MGTDECPAGGDHEYRRADESPVGPRVVVRCENCGRKPQNTRVGDTTVVSRYNRKA